MSYQDNNNQYPRSGQSRGYDDTPDYGRRYRKDSGSGYNNSGYDGNFDVDNSSYQRRNVQQRPQNYDGRPRNYDGRARQQRPQNYDGRARQQYPQNYQGRTRQRYPEGYDNRRRDVYNDNYDRRNASYDNRRRNPNSYDNRNYRGGRKPKKKTSGGIIAVRVIAVLLLLAGLGIVGWKLYGYYDAKKGHADLQGQVDGTLQGYQELYDRNHDFFGWIKIDDTVIDYPVMYTPDEPEKYLHMDFEGDYSESGELFMDANCDPDGYHYLIYGHHMFNGSMFGSLPDYGDEDYYNEHKTIHFNTRFELADYEIYAVLYSQIYDEDDTTSFKYYEMANLNSEEDYNYFVSRAKSESIYDTGITPTYGQKIITLSTCNYHTTDGRFVVCAVKK